MPRPSSVLFIGRFQRAPFFSAKRKVLHPQRKGNVLFIGRFQPFHCGHEKILAYLMKRYRLITIAIGSAQEKRTKDNPFSASERRAAIVRVARAHAGWSKRIKFAFLRDYKKNDDWTSQVRARFPSSRFAIASANPLVRKLLKKANYRLDPSPLFCRAEWEGEKIRKRIRGRDTAIVKKDIPPSLRAWMKTKGLKIIERASK